MVILNHSQQSISSQNEVIHPISETTFCPAAKPLLAIPIPTAPRVFAPYYSVPMANEVLNPDVPEFIPMDLTERTNGFTNESNETATNESNETVTNESNKTAPNESIETATNESHEMKNEILYETIKKEIYKLTDSITMPLSPNNNSPIKIDDTLPIMADSTTLDSLSEEERINRELDTSIDNTWKEVIIFIVFIICVELYLKNLYLKRCVKII